MEITQKVTVQTTAKAIFRDGQFSVEVSLAIPYGTAGRQAVTAETITDPELVAPVHAALADLAAKAAEKMLPRAQANAVECMRVAIQKKEN